MAGFPVPYSSGFALTKIDRQVSRALAQIDAAALVASHRDRAQIDRIAGTTEHGMLRAAQLGALEGALIQSAPQSAGYVHTVAVGGVWGIAAAVHEAGEGLVIALLFVLMVLTLLVKFWHFVVGALVLYFVWRWGIEPWREARALEAHDRLRHARARREIDDITFATARAMYDAAAGASGDVIEGHAIEEWRG